MNRHEELANYFKDYISQRQGATPNMHAFLNANVLEKISERNTSSLGFFISCAAGEGVLLAAAVEVASKVIPPLSMTQGNISLIRKSFLALLNSNAPLSRLLPPHICENIPSFPSHSPSLVESNKLIAYALTRMETDSEMRQKRVEVYVERVFEPWFDWLLVNKDMLSFVSHDKLTNRELDTQSSASTIFSAIRSDGRYKNTNKLWSDEYIDARIPLYSRESGVNDYPPSADRTSKSNQSPSEAAWRKESKDTKSDSDHSSIEDGEIENDGQEHFKSSASAEPYLPDIPNIEEDAMVRLERRELLKRARSPDSHVQGKTGSRPAKRRRFSPDVVHYRPVLLDIQNIVNGVNSGHTNHIAPHRTKFVPA